ncbi:XisH family protein [Roseofilum casamattae]|uniref:XisH family protein n=1 Tax=Roseofilum casamattae BLCC-M143 TaxID=3022442 RepID=A0ABT7BSA1_9CYAN|nr:XisH family protein [Roseofilum casamattae]MDJ1182068.1 XisH family protein [Roseofilum casamattae BLCC-M143]
MSAKDLFHDTVRVALEKDGWTVTHDPLSLSGDGVEFYIDLGAERLLGAEKDGQKIAVEIKSFIGKSDISQFHTALGQILNYRSALRKGQPYRILYLAIRDEVYQRLFSIPFIQDVMVEHQLKLVIFDPETEEIVLWKE